MAIKFPHMWGRFISKKSETHKSVIGAQQSPPVELNKLIVSFVLLSLALSCVCVCVVFGQPVSQQRVFDSGDLF